MADPSTQLADEARALLRAALDQEQGGAGGAAPAGHGQPTVDEQIARVLGEGWDALDVDERSALTRRIADDPAAAELLVDVMRIGSAGLDASAAAPVHAAAAESEPTAAPPPLAFPSAPTQPFRFRLRNPVLAIAALVMIAAGLIGVYALVGAGEPVGRANLTAGLAMADTIVPTRSWTPRGAEGQVTVYEARVIEPTAVRPPQRGAGYVVSVFVSMGPQRGDGKIPVVGIEVCAAAIGQPAWRLDAPELELRLGRGGEDDTERVVSLKPTPANVADAEEPGRNPRWFGGIDLALPDATPPAGRLAIQPHLTHHGQPRSAPRYEARLEFSPR